MSEAFLLCVVAVVAQQDACCMEGVSLFFVRQGLQTSGRTQETRTVHARWYVTHQSTSRDTGL